MKSALLTPVIFLAMAVGAYLTTSDLAKPILTGFFLLMAVISLLLVPASVRVGKRWERRLRTLDELADEHERQNRP